jgi:hypothetical protein
MSLKKTILNQAIQITSAYEGSGFDEVTGNFDGQGLSYGFLQWNFGQGTLQPIFKNLFARYSGVVSAILPNNGDSLRQALANQQTKQWATERQINNVMREPWKSALKNLGHTLEMQALQMEAAQYYIDTAVNQCGQFGVYTDRAFCLLFDIAVQNGSAPHVTFDDNVAYMDRLNAIVNATVSKSNSQWRSDVRNRKMAIVNGTGTVNGDVVNYTFYDAGAFYDDYMNAPLDILVSKGIVQTKDYWMEYCDGNIPCNGDYCATMIIKATKQTTLANAVAVLQARNLTNSPSYWLNNAVPGKFIEGKNMKSMIYRLASI